MSGMIDRLVRWAAIIGGLALVLLTCLTVLDVSLRYLFNRPLFGGQDVAELILLVAVSQSFAYCGRTGGHVSLDILGFVSGIRVTRAADIVVRIVSFAVMALLTWRCLENGIDAAEYGEATNLLMIPLYPFYFVLSAGFGLYGLVLLFEFFELFSDSGKFLPPMKK